MKSKEVLFKTLYWALTDIRYEAKESKQSKIFAVSHFLNNLPLELAKANNQADYDKLLAELEESIKDNNGMQKFLSEVKGNIE